MAFVIAITSAFAFKPAADSAFTFHLGARKVGSTCIQTQQNCTDVQNLMPCVDTNSNTLYKYVGSTSCPDQLWKIPN